MQPPFPRQHPRGRCHLPAPHTSGKFRMSSRPCDHCRELGLGRHQEEQARILQTRDSSIKRRAINDGSSYASPLSFRKQAHAPITLAPLKGRRPILIAEGSFCLRYSQNCSRVRTGCPFASLRWGNRRVNTQQGTTANGTRAARAASTMASTCLRAY